MFSVGVVGGFCNVSMVYIGGNINGLRIYSDFNNIGSDEVYVF